MKDLIFNWLKEFYSIPKSAQIERLINNPSFQKHEFLWMLALVVLMGIAFFTLWFVTRQTMLAIIKPIAKRTKSNFDNYLIESKFFKSISNLVPIMFLNYFLSIAFFSYPTVFKHSQKHSYVILVIVLLISFRRLLNAVGVLLKTKPNLKDKPIDAYIQTIKLVVTIVLIIALLSIITGQSPTLIFTSFGAMSAILILIFKDTILGFVGSLQVSINDMVRVGDWIEMPKYGADGFVQEITLTTVKVQNWDKTITTIPTYSLISDSFKNWRGMYETGGRRIKRHINIKVDTIKFADEELLNRLSKVKLLSEFITQQRQEIEDYNREHGLLDEYQINARRPTNIGLFRRYIEYYIRNNPDIHTELWRIVRQLQPTTKGLPLEIYCFTAKTGWGDYEPIMADIFDHIFAVIDFFDLEMHQEVTGSDINKLNEVIQEQA